MKPSKELLSLLLDSGSCFKCGEKIRILEFIDFSNKEADISLFKCQCTICGAFGNYELITSVKGELTLRPTEA